MVVESGFAGLAIHVLLVSLLVVWMAALVDSHGGLAAKAIEGEEHLASDRIHLVAHMRIRSGFHLLVLKSVVGDLGDDRLVREVRSVVLLWRYSWLAELGHRLLLLLLSCPHGVFGVGSLCLGAVVTVLAHRLERHLRLKIVIVLQQHFRVLLEELLILLHLLGLALLHALQVLLLHLLLALETKLLGQLGLLEGVLVQLADYGVVVSLAFALPCVLVYEVVIDDLDKILEALVDDVRRDGGHVGLVEQQPVRVLPLEDREVGVEERPVALEVLLRGHRLLDVVCCIDQMVQHLLLDGLRVLALVVLRYQLLDLVLCGEAGPQHQLKLAKHQQLDKESNTSR